jgi:hypothetical protein
MNQGLILMAAWRIAEKQDDFLHKVLKAKYFHDSSIWPQAQHSEISLLGLDSQSLATPTNPLFLSANQRGRFYLEYPLVPSMDSYL